MMSIFLKKFLLIYYTLASKKNQLSVNSLVLCVDILR